ncbi:hypothetical protein GUITHDRAFT_156397, partial [Guillardia theta CCMP2712]
MSPEQLLGTSGIGDVQSDVWAMGLIGYELLLGYVPFLLQDPQGSSRPAGDELGSLDKSVEEKKALIGRVKEETIPYFVSVPPRLQRVLRRATQKDSRRRHRDSAEFRQELSSAFTLAMGGSVEDTGQGAYALSVKDVAALFLQCGLRDAAAAVEANSVDGKTLLLLTDEDFCRRETDGGLGLTLLQAKRVRAEIKLLN